MARDDAAWMGRCFEAARKGRGRVSPNPMVGALVVKGGRLVAEAWHARYGGAHAEAAALKKAGGRARGATLYVSLEPCAHHGKTPPCTDAILKAGIRRVVAAMKDPHPLVNGRGFRALRKAGVEVKSGVLRREATALNRAYLTALLKGRPQVTLKAGMSLDGRIATASGQSRWITSEASRKDAHRLRAEHDAVLVGIGTALQDDPRLDARQAGRGVRQPLRAVLDSRLRLKSGSRLLASGGGAPLIIYTVKGGGAAARRLARAGAEIVPVGKGPGGVSLPRALADLARRGVHSLLVEGGGRVAWSFLDRGLADRVVWYVAPRILGGMKAVPVVGGRGAARLSGAVALRHVEISPSGPDFRVSGWVVPRGRPPRGPVLRRNRP